MNLFSQAKEELEASIRRAQEKAKALEEERLDPEKHRKNELRKAMVRKIAAETVALGRRGVDVQILHQYLAGDLGIDPVTDEPLVLHKQEIWAIVDRAYKR